MTLSFKVAQLLCVPTNVADNERAVIDALAAQEKSTACLLIVPQMFLTGPVLADCLFDKRMHQQCEGALMRLAEAMLETQTGLLIGVPRLIDGQLFNTAVLLKGGEVVAQRFASFIPQKQAPFFTPAPLNWPESTLNPIAYEGASLRIAMGEEINHDAWRDAAKAGQSAGEGEVVCHMDAALFEGASEATWFAPREGDAAFEYVICCNLMGSDGTHIYPGGSSIHTRGHLLKGLPFFQEGILDLAEDKRNETIWLEDSWNTLYEAIVFAMRSFFKVNGYERALLGLSGGIDSALTASIAVDALGPENVMGVMMATQVTSQLSFELAQGCAKALGMPYKEVRLEGLIDQVNGTILPILSQTHELKKVAKENVQARLRGLLLMTLSNQTSALVLCTGNKSEVATGYATLYGDMCGSFAPLTDVYKTHVRKLAALRKEVRPRNAHPAAPDKVVFPEKLYTRPSTAELSPGQTDEDSLPPYPVLDAYLKELLGEAKGPDDMVAAPSLSVQEGVRALLKKSAYKRHQSAPGPKVTSRCFGVDKTDPVIW